MAGKELKVDVGVNFNFLYKEYDPKSNDKQGFVLEGGGGCFSPSQGIITKDGIKSLSKVKEGDYVLSFNEETKLEEYRIVEQHHIHNNQKKCFRITLKNGSVIECTEDHKFYHEGTWIELKYLLFKEKFAKTIGIKTCQYISIPITNDISVEYNNNYYLDCNGVKILVHNSGKTWDVLEFIIFYYCEINANKGKDILITRESYAECKKTVLKDFITILKKYGIYETKNHRESHPQQYIHKGNTISFSGLDDSSAHGDRRNFIYFNELLLSNDDRAYQQLQGRCSEIFIVDYNPIYTIHWVYSKVIERPDTKFFKSTYLTNPYLSKGERDEKRGYEPTPENIKNGTADEFLYRAYTLGERAAREGIIFKYVTYITKFPDDVGYWYGLDFGYTNDETSLAKFYIDKGKKEIYAECLMYECTENPMLINDYFDSIQVSKYLPIIADSSDKYISQTKGAVEFVKDLKALGWNISKVSKTHDRYYWIGKIKEYKLFIIDSPDRPKLGQKAKQEFENFSWRVINGVQVNQPVDKYDHFISAMLYAMMGNKKNQSKGSFWN